VRLRYLKLDNYAPLSDLKVCFVSDPAWSAFSQGGPSPCAIHFVVGLNGSGKSHLLRALSAIFVALADGRLPGFAFTLIYELGTAGNLRTVIFDNPGSRDEASVWQANGLEFSSTAGVDDFESAMPMRKSDESSAYIARIAIGDFPQAVTDLLPKVLAYTSGSWTAWDEVWALPVETGGKDFRFTEDEDFPLELERPLGWSQQDEEALNQANDQPSITILPPHAYVDASDLLNRPMLLKGNRQDAAVLAVALQELQIERNKGAPEHLLADLFQKAGWQRLVSIRLRLDLEQVKAAPRAMQHKIHDALLAAGEVIALPEPGDRLRVLHFDVDAPLDQDRNYFDRQLNKAKYQDEALALLLGEQNQSAFSRFSELSRWLALGLIQNIELSIRRNAKPSHAQISDSGVMSYTDLSDGEQMVLRRWALFHLLAGQQDALLLLDEPETHFNDAWKREIVSVIEQAMGEDASSVLIATHSSIVISDVFDEEILHIQKTPDGTSQAIQVGNRTFGTDPSALMMSLFKTDDSIGLRAQRRIEAFTAYIRDQQSPIEQRIRELQLVISRLGTGFHRSELRTLLKELQEDDDKRALKQSIMTLESVQLKTKLLTVLDQSTPDGSDDA
jgi:energy-coupling factor transporter ATP-binding protein EcfA2